MFDDFFIQWLSCAYRFCRFWSRVQGLYMSIANGIYFEYQDHNKKHNSSDHDLLKTRQEGRSLSEN